jgi:5-methylcytosine-specific restriction enzyme A
MLADVSSSPANLPSSWAARSAMGGRRLRLIVHERAGGKCWYCGVARSLLTIDHVVPLVAGGSNHIDNLVGACSVCNSTKGNMSELTFRRDVLPLVLAWREAGKPRAALIAAIQQAKGAVTGESVSGE